MVCVNLFNIDVKVIKLNFVDLHNSNYVICVKERNVAIIVDYPEKYNRHSFLSSVSHPVRHINKMS